MSRFDLIGGIGIAGTIALGAAGLFLTDRRHRRRERRALRDYWQRAAGVVALARHARGGRRRLTDQRVMRDGEVPGVEG